VIVIMLGGFVMCAFCFFGPQLLDLLHTVTGGRYGKQHIGMQKLYGSDWDEQVALAASRPREKRRKKKGRGKPEEGYISVTVETAAMTQKKQLCVEEVGQYADLLALIFDEFGPLLKGRSEREVLLFCYGESREGVADHESDDKERELTYAWLLVVSKSDIAQVLSSCSALKLTEKAEGHKDENFECAFLVGEESPHNGTDKKDKKDKKGRMDKKGKKKKELEAKELKPDKRTEKSPEELLADALKQAPRDELDDGEGSDEEGEGDETHEADSQVTGKTSAHGAKYGALHAAGRAAADGLPEKSDSEDEDEGNQAGLGAMAAPPAFNPGRFTAARYNEDDGFSVIGAMHAAQRSKSGNTYGNRVGLD